MNDLKPYKSLQEFTPQQIQKFDSMHKALREFNADLRKGNTSLPPEFSDEEMSEYSIYRQLLLASETEDEN